MVVPPLPPPLPVAPPEPPVMEEEPPEPEPPDPEATAPPEPALMEPPEPVQPTSRGNTALSIPARPGRRRILIYGVTSEGRLYHGRAADYWAKHSFIISDQSRSPTWFPPDWVG